MVEWSESVVRLANAIKKAENSPVEWNNPGSLTGSDAGGFQMDGFGNKEGVWKFVNAADGWQALYLKIDRMLSGKSKVYHLTDTLETVGMKYSGGDPNWAINVAAALGVDPSTTLEELSGKEAP
jgi:hypothetical protein